MSDTKSTRISLRNDVTPRLVNRFTTAHYNPEHGVIGIVQSQGDLEGQQQVLINSSEFAKLTVWVMDNVPVPTKAEQNAVAADILEAKIEALLKELGAEIEAAEEDQKEAA